MKLLPSQPLQVANPQEGASDRHDLVGHRLEEREYLGHVPQLAEDVDLQGLPPLSKERQSYVPPGMDGSPDSS